MDSLKSKKRQRRANNWRVTGGPPPIDDNAPPKESRERTRTEDLRVIRWRDWCTLKGMSRWTANRMRKRGDGPRIVKLGPRAIGVTVRDDREWTESRIREGA